MWLLVYWPNSMGYCARGHVKAAELLSSWAWARAWATCQWMFIFLLKRFLLRMYFSLCVCVFFIYFLFLSRRICAFCLSLNACPCHLPLFSKALFFFFVCVFCFVSLLLRSTHLVIVIVIVIDCHLRLAECDCGCVLFKLFCLLSFSIIFFSFSFLNKCVLIAAWSLA